MSPASAGHRISSYRYLLFSALRLAGKGMMLAIATKVGRFRLACAVGDMD
jgi:hypothetical protein